MHNENRGHKPEGVPPVEPRKPEQPPKRPEVPPVEVPRREVKPERPHGGQVSSWLFG